MPARSPSLDSLLVLLTCLSPGAYLAGCTSDDATAPPAGDGGADGGAPDGTVSTPDGGGGSTSDGAAGDAMTGATDASTGGDDGGSGGDDDDEDGGDGGFSGPCPTGNHAGAIATPDATCLAFTPTVTGASPLGENPDNANYALTPSAAAGANGKLVLFLDGTGGHPSDSIADPSLNLYNAATALGYQVLAISYHSIETVATQCQCVDSCYFPSRETIIRGVLQPGAAADLAADGGIRVDESIAGRTELALRWLVANDAPHQAAWGSYLTTADPSSPPETQIDWTKVVVVGHSQGGGHAAAVGKLFPVARVIQLSSTCDTVLPPADCTKASGDYAEVTAATWTNRDSGTWATPATSFWGLDAKTVYDGGSWVSGDGNCFLHAQIWQNEQEPATQIDDDGGICGATTSVQNHNASIDCDENFATWTKMLQ